ncbi:hypothetical protein LSAT2_014666 [Lamellibrachia satsuma]|nr:hypothetical protein LSAT2_014666 [Lamellibrachia satsuma]
MGTPNEPYFSPPLQHACPSDERTPEIAIFFLDTEVSVEGVLLSVNCCSICNLIRAPTVNTRILRMEEAEIALHIL